MFNIALVTKHCAFCITA